MTAQELIMFFPSLIPDIFVEVIYLMFHGRHQFFWSRSARSERSIDGTRKEQAAQLGEKKETIQINPALSWRCIPQDVFQIEEKLLRLRIDRFFNNNTLFWSWWHRLLGQSNEDCRSQIQLRRQSFSRWYDSNAHFRSFQCVLMVIRCRIWRLYSHQSSAVQRTTGFHCSQWSRARQRRLPWFHERHGQC